MEGNPFSQGFPFEIDDILQPFSPLNFGDPDIFAIPELQPPSTGKQDGDLYIPKLGAVTGIGEYSLEPVDSDAESVSTNISVPSATGTEALEDVWTLDLNLGEIERQPRFWTWESFEKKDVSYSEKLPYLSEAGPAAFDAALATTLASSSSSGVLPQDVMLTALYNLVLGRSSIFFQWNASKTTFEPTLRDTPTSGLSLDCHQSLVNKLMDCGSKYRTLSAYASHSPSRKQICTALIAFKGCITSILDGLESFITSRGAHARSLLQLQTLVDRPHQLLVLLNRFVKSVEGQTNDEAIIRSILDEVHRIACTENVFSEVLQEMLARMRNPWLERLCADLGLREAPTTASAVKLDTDPEEAVDESNLSFVEPAPRTKELPGLLSSDDRAFIHETKRSLKLLRRHLPFVDLSSQVDPCLSRRVPQTYHQIAYPSAAAQIALDTLLSASSEPADNNLSGDDHTVSVTNIDLSSDEQLAWGSGQIQQSYVADLESRMSRPLQLISKDSVQLAVATALRDPRRNSTNQSNHLIPALPFDPLDQIRPLIQSHAAHINRVLLRYLFKQRNLRQHLDIQRQFHLLGNGDFLSRISKALFSADTQSAERGRGRIPTAETIGLRLGARDAQKWPPASSEIQLTLMGILSESYHSNVRQTDIFGSKRLPGNFSFAIRELPEEEIEKVLDSSSIYALDFLKMQYTPAPSLDVVLTATAMQAYDDIFRFLLKLLRVLHITTTLRATFGGRNPKRRPEVSATEKFAIESHHVVTVIMSHFVDVGIEATWSTFQTSLSNIEASMERSNPTSSTIDNAIGLDGLRQLHETCLEGIRTKLFLRRKQQKLRNAIENTMIAVMKCASVVDNDGDTGPDCEMESFRDSVNGLLTVLRAAVDKQANTSLTGKAAEDDVEATRMLLMRLDWNDFYADSGPR